MEQHPVPQHIASFEFKLFGNLTVRQFVTLAIPMSLAAAIFFSPLTSIIRIPLAVIVAAFALFASLVPIGGRPFDKWVVAFVKAVLSPTQRVWVKETKIPQFLNVVVSPGRSEEKVPENITIQGRERLKNYLRSLPQEEATPLDVKEQIAVSRLGLANFVSSAGGTMEAGSGGAPIIWPTSSVSRPQGTRERMNLSGNMDAGSFGGKIQESLPSVEIKHQPAAPVIKAESKPFALSGLEKKLRREEAKHEAVNIAPVKAQLASESNFTIENVIPIKTAGKRFRLIHGIGKTRVRKLHFAPPEGFDLSKLPIRGERRFEISEELKKRYSTTNADLWPKEEAVAPSPVKKMEVKPRSVVVPKVSPARIVPKNSHLIQKQSPASVMAQNVALKKTQDNADISDSKISVFKSQTNPNVGSASAAQMMPLTTNPNIISGLVCDQGGTPLERIILVIKDSQGIPVRALKTNKLGQFLSATPLPVGKYIVDVESNVHTFRPFEVNIEGKMIEPILIRSEGLKG